MSGIRVIQNGWEVLPATTILDENGKKWIMREGWDPTEIGQTRPGVVCEERDVVGSTDFNMDFHEREAGYVPVNALHWHPLREEMFLVMEGKGKGVVYNKNAEREIDLEPGTLVYIPIGARHHFQVLATATGDEPIKVMEMGTGQPKIVANPKMQMDVYVGRDAQQKVEALCRNATPPVAALLDRFCFVNEGAKNIAESTVIQNGWTDLPLTTVTGENGKKWLMRMGYDPSGQGRDIINGSPDFNVILHTREVGYKAPRILHWHPLRDEMYIVLSGKGTAVVDEEEIEIGRGTLIYVPKEEKHYPLALATAVGDEPLKIVEMGTGEGIIKANPYIPVIIYVGREASEEAEALAKAAKPAMDELLDCICFDTE